MVNLVEDWFQLPSQEIHSGIRSRLDWREIFWHRKFFFGRHNDRWYASLFKGAGGKIKGEITPSYSVLEPKDIRRIKEIMPGVKIIYVIRNPIDRAWSAIRYRKLKEKAGRSLDSLSLDDLKRMVEREGMSLRGDYARTINNWGGYFPEEQFFIGFFEDIVENPKWLLSRIFEFLGVNASDEHTTKLAFERVNPSPRKEMSPEFRLYLAEKYYPQIKTLSKMVGGHAIRWRRETEELLRK